MGILYDYFAAADDAQAAAVVDRTGGPAAPSDRPRPRRLFSRSVPDPAPAPVVLDTVPDTGIDPVVVLATLEELLTGRSLDEVVADPRSGAVLAAVDDGAVQVVTLTDALCRALATADDAQLAAVAVPWSQTEELRETSDLAASVEVLQQLAGLARRAGERGARVYCWTAL